jgi:hypothetical protein
METLADLAASRIPGLRSLLLGGSFARGEGTFLQRRGHWAPYKDYDLFAVVDPRHARAAALAVSGFRQAAYEHLDYPPYDEESPSPGQFQISLAVVPINALPRLPHDLSNAELKLMGRVIWGEDVRGRIRSDPRLIPPASGLRPVLNKLVGLVEQWGTWINDRSEPDPEVRLAIAYDQAKMVLDLAGALLLLRHSWTAGYAARNDVLCAEEARGPVLAEIGRIASRAQEALEFKLRPRTPRPEEGAHRWRGARDELLRIVDPLAAAVLSYRTATPVDGARRFATGARIGLLRPFAEQAMLHYGVPFGRRLSPLAVLAYAAMENARLGSVGKTHPLIRAWSAAWAWLSATAHSEEAGRLLPWAAAMVGSSHMDFVPLRTDIVRLFKAASTARRRKRTL